jgi:putative endonuclease
MSNNNSESSKLSKKWYVYIIECSDASLYTGITTDVKRRFSEHEAQSNKTAKYLRGKAPLKLVGVLEADSRSDATKLELEIKSLTREQKLKFLNK